MISILITTVTFYAPHICLTYVHLFCIMSSRYRLDVESRDLRDFKAEGPGL